MGLSKQLMRVSLRYFSSVKKPLAVRPVPIGTKARRSENDKGG